MTTLRTYEADDLPALVEVWNATFGDLPNRVQVGSRDLRYRVLDQPSFDPSGLLVAERAGEVLGFVHFGPRTNLWSGLSQRRPERKEGHIYVVVDRRTGGGLAGDLLGTAVERLAARGARRVLLGPSWVHGTQPFYNGIAGAYEFPGLSSTRDDLIALAQDAGFTVAAEYGTPDLDLGNVTHVEALQAAAADTWGRAGGWGLVLRVRAADSPFFPPRNLVELVRGREMVAVTAYGSWPEYTREHGRRLYGITNVHVSPKWRGKGLGKLIVVRAIEAARDDGAEAVHLHVWRGNKPAWKLYHSALGFQPGPVWVTLAKEMR